MKAIVLALLIFLLSSTSVLASGFHLKSIGGVETGGIQGGKWWHTQNQPTLTGEGSPGTTADITIDGTLYKTDVNSDADWTFTPPALADGEHQIQFINQGSSFTITLVTGKENVDWDAVGKGVDQTLPTVGVTWPTIALVLFSLVGFGTSLGILKK